MIRLTRLTSVGFALSGFIFAGSVQAGEPKPPNLAGQLQQAYCMSGYLDFNAPAAHFSAIVNSVVEQSPGQSATDVTCTTAEKLTKSFRTFLDERYGFIGSADCYLNETQNKWTEGGCAASRSAIASTRVGFTSNELMDSSAAGGS